MEEQFEEWWSSWQSDHLQYHPERVFNYSLKDLLEEAFLAGWDFRRNLEL